MRKFIFLILTCFYSLLGFAQMTVNNTAPRNNPYWLAANVLADPNLPIMPPLDPITFMPIVQPNTTLIGTFNAAGTGFPIDSGIVMCNSSIADVLPNINGIPVNTGPHVDPDLSAVLQQIGTTSQVLNDRAELIFSFVATGDSVQFNYVFASHEYPLYTCSSFNDVFGFFLSGPGINGNPAVSTVNLATIPGTTVPVAVNTINQGFAGGAGIASRCLLANPNYAAHSIFYNPSNGTITSVGGYTTKFTAGAQVTCGNIYTIRLALANVEDHALSSAVFLESQSFTIPTISIIPNINSSNSFTDSAIVEGCSVSYLKFKKHGNISYPMTISLTIDGTATAGVDYAALPTSLTIPAGQTEDSLLILVYEDGIAEPLESIIVTMQPVTTPCHYYPGQQVTLWIRDKNPVFANVVASSDTVFCPGDQITLQSTITGGDGVLSGWWGDSPTPSQIRVVQPSITTTYYYYGVDECGNDTAVDSTTIYIADYFPMEYAFEDTLVCPGFPVTFHLNISEGLPPYQYMWQDGTTNSSYTFTPTKDSTWISFEVEDYCGNKLTGSLLARVAPKPVAAFTFKVVDGMPMRIKFKNESTFAHTYAWDFGDGQTSTEENPFVDYARAGFYLVRLTITSIDGCIATFATEIKIESDFFIYVPTAFTPNSDGTNDCFEIKGVGFDAFEIKIFDRWGGQVFFSDNIEHCWDGIIGGEPAPQGAYTFVIFLRLPFDKIHERRGMVTVYR